VQCLGEALCADMGQLGRFPIRLAWLAVVLPALVLNSRSDGDFHGEIKSARNGRFRGNNLKEISCVYEKSHNIGKLRIGLPR
jgi:hypothetical protein